MVTKEGYIPIWIFISSFFIFPIWIIPISFSNFFTNSVNLISSKAIWTKLLKVPAGLTFETIFSISLMKKCVTVYLEVFIRLKSKIRIIFPRKISLLFEIIFSIISIFLNFSLTWTFFIFNSLTSSHLILSMRLWHLLWMTSNCFVKTFVKAQVWHPQSNKLTEIARKYGL